MEKKPSFEESLKRLEGLTAALESGEGSLDEMIARYEEGMKLVKLCTEQLDAYEKRIEKLNEAERA